MEIKIGKSGKHCHATGTPFAHGDEIISLLRLLDHELIREDYGRPFWVESQGESAMAVWSGRYIDPSIAEQGPPENFSPMRRIFYEAAASEDRVDLAVAYLAAQLLRRQKVFRLIKEADESEGIGRIALYSDRIGDKLIEVRDPNLTYAEMEDGRVILMERLVRLESPEEPAEEPVAVVES